ncbi:MAG TPA: DNA-3-methyladenine glycosylase [Acidimicrobiia bacterium]|nr:DNA-3-methyladenine glycosylase [Acidimicrobiia bacterium]
MRDLLAAAAPEVAPLLLGSVLTTRLDGRETSVVIVEVEAYTPSDPASHSYRGPTERNRSMYGAPGTLYVYRSYGVHWCVNISTGAVGEGSAVLIRAGAVHTGQDVMAERRGRRTHLCDGPGKLAQALGIDDSFDGADSLDPSAPVRLTPGSPLRATATPRIGISRAVDVPWRWVAVEPVLSPFPQTGTLDDHR